MHTKHVEAGQMIAVDLLALEDQIDATIASGGRLPATMMAARAHAQLPAAVGQEALRHTAKAFELMVQARQHVVQAHAALATAGNTLGLQTAFGDQYECPKENGALESEAPVRLVA